MLPLALPWVQLAPGAAVAALTSAVAFQGLNYSGFHSYVQDVAPGDAGLVLAITNTCGTLVGIVGNLLTGYLAASAYGYAGELLLQWCDLLTCLSVYPTAKMDGYMMDTLTVRRHICLDYFAAKYQLGSLAGGSTRAEVAASLISLVITYCTKNARDHTNKSNQDQQ